MKKWHSVELFFWKFIHKGQVQICCLNQGSAHAACRMPKKVGSRLRSVTQIVNQGHVPVTAWKGAVKIIKYAVSPLFCKFGNRKSYQIGDPYKNRDLSPLCWENTGPILCIQDFQYKRCINLNLIMISMKYCLNGWLPVFRRHRKYA